MNVSSSTFWMHNSLVLAPLKPAVDVAAQVMRVLASLKRPDDTWLTLAEEEAERSRDCVLIYYLASNLTVIICRLLH